MSRRVFAVDPGTRLCAWAILGHGVSQVGLVRSAADTLSARAAVMARALRSITADCPVDKVVVEVPRSYRTSRQKGDQNDLLDLSFVAGAVAATLSISTRTTTPREWKGTVPKHIHHARLAEEVPEVIEQIGQFPKSLRHNIWDAVGLALWELKRKE